MTPEPPPAANAHALPPAFVGTLFAALLGGLVPGIYMTLVSAPGNAGSPVYGLVLPWTVLPFLLSVASGWRGRFGPAAGRLRTSTILVSVAGSVLYTYFLLVDAEGNRNVKVFLWIPLWQWAVMARPMLAAVRQAPPGPDPDAPAAGPRPSGE